jgi:nitrilase
MPRIAVVQMPLVLLDRARTLEQTVSAVRRAAAGGADIVVFPEAFIPAIAPTYDSGERWLATMQHIAREGGCWVVGCGCALQARDIPDSMPGKLDLYPNADEWINCGNSVVVAPGGKIAAGPMHDAYGILYADVQLERVGIARRSLDAAGHYSRSDIFKLQVDRKPVAFIKLNDTGDPQVS